MVTRTAFGEWLKNEIRRRGLTRRALAAAIGIGHVAIGNWINHGDVPDTTNLRALADYMRVEASYLLSLLDNPGGTPRQGERRVVPLRIIGRAAADPAQSWSGDDDTFYWSPDFPVADADQYCAVTVDGDCLVPDINPGELAVIHRSGQLIPGCFVAVRVDGMHHVKRLEVDGGEYRLSANDGRAVIPYGEANVVGVVIEVHRRRQVYPPRSREIER